MKNYALALYLRFLFLFQNNTKAADEKVKK
jgi:hypothetical protein